MTIEVSLRKRALIARLAAYLQHIAIFFIVVLTLYYLPSYSHWTIKSISSALLMNNAPSSSTLEYITHTFSLTIIITALILVAYSCHLLAKAAQWSLTIATQYSGLADALCIAGDKPELLDKYITLLVPTTNSPISPTIISEKERDAIIDLIRKIK